MAQQIRSTTNESVIFNFLGEPSIKLSTLADYVLQLSDFFVDQPENQTPWSADFCKQAYRYYFLPLNYIRNEQVIQRGLVTGFFDNITETYDWGAGPGTASLALAQEIQKLSPSQLKKQTLIELSTEAIQAFSDLKKNLINPTVTSQTQLPQKPADTALLVFSYSLTEMKELPSNVFHFNHIMILEPSTQDDGRKLMNLREQFIKKGFHVWGPCTHQKTCPLLQFSKNDWCHDRYKVHAPQWFWNLEQQLPIKNNTITTSYLLLSKTPPPANLKNYSRLVGDSLLEKGKTRQLVCRDSQPSSVAEPQPSSATEPQREFLTWMHKNVEPQIFPRGELVELPPDLELKANELRVQKQHLAHVLPVIKIKKT